MLKNKNIPFVKKKATIGILRIKIKKRNGYFGRKISFNIFYKKHPLKNITFGF